LLEDLIGMPLLQQVFVGIFALAWGLGVLSWLAIVIYALRIPFNAKPGSLHGWLKFNPLNVAFFSGKLTPKGVVMRKRLLISAGCFFVCLAVGALSGVIAKALTQG
jgi:hypothetical protein